jgi:hypothetical protein
MQSCNCIVKTFSVDTEFKVEGSRSMRKESANSVNANPLSAAEAAARISLPMEEKMTRRCFDEDQSRMWRIAEYGVEPVSWRPER